MNSCAHGDLLADAFLGPCGHCQHGFSRYLISVSSVERLSSPALELPTDG